MPIKKLDAALRFLERMYAEHRPTTDDFCSECGYGWPCSYSDYTADILGLPRIESIYALSDPESEDDLGNDLAQYTAPAGALTADQLQLQAQYDLAHWNPDGA